MTKLDSVENRRHYSANKGLYSQGFGLPSVMFHCESWTVKEVEHVRIDAFEIWSGMTPESPLDSKEIKPINPKGNEL